MFILCLLLTYNVHIKIVFKIKSFRFNLVTYFLVSASSNYFFEINFYGIGILNLTFFSVKIHDLKNLQETLSVITLPQESGIDRMSWSSDGQLLAVSTKGGSVNVYITYMPLLTSICLPRMAILTNLTEISVFNYSTDKVINICK